MGNTRREGMGYVFKWSHLSCGVALITESKRRREGRRGEERGCCRREEGKERRSKEESREDLLEYVSKYQGFSLLIGLHSADCGKICLGRKSGREKRKS